MSVWCRNDGCLLFERLGTSFTLEHRMRMPLVGVDTVTAVGDVICENDVSLLFVNVLYVIEQVCCVLRVV